MKDLKVQRAVTTELAWEPSLHSADIAVSVKSGIATLNGTVRSLPEKWAAEEAAQRVAGVTAVVDETVVELPGEGQRSDSDIARCDLLRAPAFSFVRLKPVPDRWAQETCCCSSRGGHFRRTNPSSHSSFFR